MNGTLTPATVGSIFERKVQPADTPGWFQLVPAGANVDVKLQANSIEGSVTWIEFDSLHVIGLTFGDLERLYGVHHRKLPPGKEGMTVIFETGAPSAYVAARLSSASAESSSPVSYLQLRYPR